MTVTETDVSPHSFVRGPQEKLQATPIGAAAMSGLPAPTLAPGASAWISAGVIRAQGSLGSCAAASPAATTDSPVRILSRVFMLPPSGSIDDEQLRADVGVGAVGLGVVGHLIAHAGAQGEDAAIGQLGV